MSEANPASLFFALILSFGLLLLPSSSAGGSYSISPCAFAYMDTITKITIPESVHAIYDNAFLGCDKLLQYENGVYYVDKWVITADNVAEITVREGSVGIAASAFFGIPHYGFANYEKVILPDSIKYICEDAFYDCQKLMSIKLPESLVYIGGQAFYNCKRFTNITIPANVTYISDTAFERCDTIVEVINKSSLDISKDKPYENGYLGSYALEIHNGSSKIKNIDDCLFYTYDGKTYLIGYIGDDTELVLPSSFNGNSYEIYKQAFYKNERITAVVIPDSVETIGVSAFYECTSLNNITIGDSVETIGAHAFYGCKNLGSITIGNGVKTIDNYAFGGEVSLSDIYYAGSESEWNAVTIYGGNDSLDSAQKHYNYAAN